MPPKEKIVSSEPALAPKANNEEDVARRCRLQIDHILLRPQMYLGRTENHSTTMWMFREGAVRTDLPDLLPPGAFENKLTELHLGTVKLAAEGEIDANLEDLGTALDQATAEEPETVNGVDKRLLASEGPVTAFPPGSQVVDKLFINPSLLKIVDESILSAADNRLIPSPKKQTYIRVSFDQKTGEIAVQNDGAAIPIVVHPDHKMYVPEMIFGTFLTPSDYGDDPKFIAASRHGFGVRLTNILSTRFTVECVADNMRFVGTWVDNMKKKVSSEVSPFSHLSDYTKVSFIPEYSRFTEVDLKKANEALRTGAAYPDTLIPADFDIIAQLGKILKRRLLDLSASIGPALEVYYNDELLTPRNFTEYVRMHMPEGSVSRQPFVQGTALREGDALSCDYGLFIVPPAKGSPTQLQQQHVSLVNGIVTYQGGTHLRHLVHGFDAALEQASAHLEKEERLMLNVAQIKQHTTLFVNVLVHQPKFDSHSRDHLISEHIFAPIKTSELVRHILLLPFIRHYCTTSDEKVM